MLRSILTILFILVCVALCVIVLMQKGRDSGISGLTGGSSGDTYWSKNKSRSREGMMIMLTRVFSVAAILLAAVLNISFK
ncbi:MAG: preprotein translocase subunit SecG [Lachnospiraceae bacterium]|nr:preprotein translocase subunit SecG [Lachnospiraceae bacterium]